MCRSIFMWYNHPFNQRNRTTQRKVGVGVGGDRQVQEGGEGWPKFEKGLVGNIGLVEGSS